MPINLSKIAKAKKIKYFLISFVDFFGVLRSKLVPTQAIADMQKNERPYINNTWFFNFEGVDLQP